MKMKITSLLAALLLAGCGSSGAPATDSARQDDPPAPVDEPAYPSAEWAAREQANYARTLEAPRRHSTDPAFQQRWQTQSLANRNEYAARNAADPYWASGENACSSWGGPCTGDPYRYPGVDSFYDDVGEVIPVNFYDAEGARLSGRVWAPRQPPHAGTLPSVVIINGSVQAPETLYWWAAQMLVEQGYVVMTFDPRGQGRSDSRTPDGQAGSNANSVVFRRNLIDAIDFFLSTPSAPYAHNLPGTPGHDGDGGQAQTTAYNPFFDRIDRDRLGVAGHSLGAIGVSVVQGEQPWPGTAVRDNPIKAVVAWDNLALQSSLDGVAVVPRVPAMGQAGDYFLAPTPYTEPPSAEEKNGGFRGWQEAGVPVFQVQIRGGTHYEWSLLPEFPATDWEAGGEGGWGQPMARHYTLAWFDRWLKRPGEPGYADADARLLDDASWRERMSFYFPSQRAYPDRGGRQQVCLDLRRGC